MRHGKKINHLGRTASHRKAMLSNMATSLIQNKRIVTTVAKAKALRKYVEPLITKSKTDSTHSRRMVFKYLQDKESVNILFNEVSEKVADRPGGYTRILKTGNRLGDNASMCVIELVDYNESLLSESKPKRSRTRRSRRGKGKEVAAVAAAATAEQAVEAVAESAEEVAVAEEVAEEVTETAAEVTETTDDTQEAAEEQTQEVASAEETAEETAEAAEEKSQEESGEDNPPEDVKADEEE